MKKGDMLISSSGTIYCYRGCKDGFACFWRMSDEERGIRTARPDLVKKFIAAGVWKRFDPRDLYTQKEQVCDV